GASFSEELVVASLDEPPDAGVWRRLGEYLDEQPDGQWRFRHALVRDAAYEGLPYRRRQELHERVGTIIEGRGAEPEDDAELLSLHFFHARDFERAWRYSRVAGERAAAIYANVEAATFFERALAAARVRRRVSTVDRAEVLERLGDVRVRLADFDVARASYAAGRRLVPDDPVTQGRFLLQEAKTHYRGGRFADAIR